MAGEKVFMNLTSPRGFKAFVREHRLHNSRRGSGGGGRGGSGGSGFADVASRNDGGGGGGGGGGSSTADALRLFAFHPDFVQYVGRLFQGGARNPRP
jgi:hypothetical protein